MGVRSILSIPAVYRLFTYLIGARRSRESYVRDYLRPAKGDRILDIGCGPGDILEYLPEVDYVGFDMSADYIDAATERFGRKGKFYCKDLNEESLKDIGKFDIVMANGVLHHLNDEEAVRLFDIARKFLKPSGRLVTFDGCVGQPGQSWLARYIILKDRGRFVRTKEGYTRLASKVFKSVSAECRSGMLNMPYTHIILICSK